jgi:hypothetical protein
VGRWGWLKVEANFPKADVGAGLALPHGRLHAIGEEGESKPSPYDSVVDACIWASLSIEFRSL